MKNKFTLQLFFSFIAILFSAQVNAQTAPASDKELTLNPATLYSAKVVQVSFDGAETSGSFDVMNAEGFVVKHMDVVELIRSPYYFSVDVSEFKEGIYTFIVKTAVKTYSSSLSIK